MLHYPGQMTSVLTDLKQPSNVRFAEHQAANSLTIEWTKPRCGETGYIDHFVVSACHHDYDTCDCRQDQGEFFSSRKHIRESVSRSADRSAASVRDFSVELPSHPLCYLHHHRLISVCSQLQLNSTQLY